jgi:hypothetical protein
MTYNPPDFLRRINKPLLGQFFAARGLLGDVAWATMPSRDTGPVMHAWRRLSDQQQEAAEQIFRQVWHLGTTDGIRIAIDESRHPTFCPDQDLAGALEAEPGLLNKALWIYLHRISIFQRAGDFLTWDQWGRRTRWKRTDLPPHVTPDVSEPATEALRSRISAHYVATEGCGRQCTIDLHRRGSTHLWFLYPEDYSEEHLTYEDGALAPRTLHPAFQVIFAYDARHGSLEVCARSKAAGRQQLEAIFAETVLHQTLPEPVDARPTYTPACLLDRTHVCRHGDGIAAVRVRSLRCLVHGAGTRARGPLVTFNAGASEDPRDIHHVIDRLIGAHTNRHELLSVRSATLDVFFDTLNRRGQRTRVEFTITTPDSCSLDDTPEHQLIRSRLVAWGLEAPGVAAARQAS